MLNCWCHRRLRPEIKGGLTKPEGPSPGHRPPVLLPWRQPPARCDRVVLGTVRVCVRPLGVEWEAMDKGKDGSCPRRTLPLARPQPAVSRLLLQLQALSAGSGFLSNRSPGPGVWHTRGSQTFAFITQNASLVSATLPPDYSPVSQPVRNPGDPAAVCRGE